MKFNPFKIQPSSTFLPCLLTAALLGCSATLSAQSLEWIGDAGSGNWDTAGNWSPEQVPDNGDSLFFNNNVQTTQTATAVTLESMTWGASAGAFTVSGGNLTFNGVNGGLFNQSAQSQTVSSTFMMFSSNPQTVDNGDESFTLGGEGATTRIRFREDMIFDGGGNTSIAAGALEIRFNPVFTVNAGTVTINSTLSQETATASNFLKAGAGTLELLAANTFGGNFFLNGGTLVVGNNGALGNGSFNMGSSGGTVGTLRSADGIDLTFANNATLQNTLNVEGGSTLTFDGASGTFGSSPVVNIEGGTTLRLNGDMSGSSLVTKQGDGTFILAGDNSGHSGNVTAQGGTLKLANISGAGAGTGDLTVFAAATLSGDGLSGNAAVIMNGILSPGANGGQDEGTLSFNLSFGNKLSFGSNSKLVLQADDRIAFTAPGDWLSVSSGAQLDLSGDGWIQGWNTFGLNVDTLPENIGLNMSLTMDSTETGFMLDAAEPFRIHEGNLQLNLTAIPEPATYALILGLGMLALAFHRGWKRYRQ